MKNIGVLTNCRKPEACRVLQRLADKCSALGMGIFVTSDEEKQRLESATQVETGELGARVDVLLALGGDGTVLRAARMLSGADKPILGVNLGSLGFLTSVTEADLERALDVLSQGDYLTSVRTIAECTVSRDGVEIGGFRGLNDVVMGWGQSTRVVTLDVDLDGERVASYNCDGLIISTPTGSTGHSLSAGGPILHPESPSFVITIICPHTLSSRPVVVSDTSTIMVRVQKATTRLLLSVDGQEGLALQDGDSLVVKRAAQGIRFVHLPGYSYFSVLRQKLLWRGSSIAAE